MWVVPVISPALRRRRTKACLLYTSESRARLNNARFLSRVQARGTSDLTAEEKCELLIRCCETIGGKGTADYKIGVILLGDENEGYTYAHIEGIRAAIEALNIPEENVIWKYSVPENENCYDAAVDLAEQGCTHIFSNSYGHQSFMVQAAEEFPEVTFCAGTGDTAATCGLNNVKNYFNYTFEARYVSGIVAGMKLKELMDAGEVTDPHIGYVGAYPYAEVVSGYTAFLLGIQSIVPEAYMDVVYTSSWFDPTAEAEAANALIAMGCVIVLSLIHI